MSIKAQWRNIVWNENQNTSSATWLVICSISMQISINWLLIFKNFFTSVDVSNAYVVKISLWIFDPFLEDTHTDGQLSVGLGIGWSFGVGDEGEGEGSLGVGVSASRVDPTLAWWHLRWRVRSSFIIQTGRRIKNRTVCRYMKTPLVITTVGSGSCSHVNETCLRAVEHVRCSLRS